MDNQEKITAAGRTMFFKNLWSCVSDVLDNLPGQVSHLRITVETNTGHRLVDLPLEKSDEEFARTVLTGILQLSADKCSAAGFPGSPGDYVSAADTVTVLYRNANMGG